MKATYYTKVGSCSVPVIGAEKPTIAAFAGAKRGKGGVYAFWTAEFKKAAGNGKRKLWGRAKIGLSAGDRFDRMGYERHEKSLSAGDRAIYDYYWKSMGAGKNVKLIRPSTEREVYMWLKTHCSSKFGRCEPIYP